MHLFQRIHYIVGLALLGLLPTAHGATPDLPALHFSPMCNSEAERITSVAYDELNADNIGKFLGWVRDPKDTTLCGGHYYDSANILSTPNPLPMQEAPLNISATKPSFFTQSGASLIQGDVKLTQPGREITADQVTLMRDNTTGKIKNGVLVGHVRFIEYGKMMVAQQGHLDFINKVHTFDNGVYRLLTNTPTGLASIWGRAKHAVRDAVGVLKLKKVTYSSCPPDAESWHLWSNNLTLDRDTGRGVATNAVLLVQNVPVLYTPYINFPIDKRRQSGFLYPTPSYNKDSGFGVNIPYYFNLAPNYDATFTPNYFSRRGVLLDGQFRYLTPINSGEVNLDYISADRAFAKFRDKTADQPNKAVTALKESSASRGFLNLHNDASFSEHWQGNLDINYATDDYFLQDFGTDANTIDNDQLLNQADIKYATEHWHFLGRVQLFQTLHPITQDAVADQYRRLPQLDLTGDFPEGAGGLSYQFSGEAVNFTHRHDFYSDTPIIQGSRFNIAPTISLPLNWLGGYIKPAVQLGASEFVVRTASPVTSTNRIVPLFSVDSGLVFSREMNFLHDSFIQTLEPRLFYLFVPTKNQDDLPVFDTVLPPLDFSQLFRANRFSGIDRIGDANQVTAALTTRFLNDDGQEKLNAGVGQILALHKHQVIIPNGTHDALANESLSPVVGQLQYYITSQWNTTANLAWDPNYHRFDTTTYNLQYVKDPQHLLNFWYNYTLNGDINSADLSRIGSSLAWNLWRNWNIVGRLDYNLSYHRPQNYLYGLEYDSCCWAVRLVNSKTFVGTNTVSKQSTYNSAIYLQFLLKGLGNFGASDAGSMLTSQVSGYHDKFATGF